MDTITQTIRSLMSYYTKTTLLVVVTLLCTSSLLAQRSGGSGTIYGRILDADTGRFMQNAEVSIEGSILATASEQGGFYVINSVPEGECTVAIHYVGYVTEKKTITVPADGKISVDFDMHLTPSKSIPATSLADDKKENIIELEKITVTTERAGNARAFMDQKKSMTMSTVLSADSFGTVQNGNIAEFLRNMSGISVIEDDATGEANEISIGGMDPQYTGVFLDGARMASGAKAGFDENSRSFQFDQISINGIESIEVRRTVSADMEGDAPAGGISMKTKSAFDSKGAHFRYNAYLSANSYNMSLSRTPGADDGKNYKILPGFSLTYSTPFNKGRMGLVVDAGYQKDFRENNRATIDIYDGSWTKYNPFVNKVTYRNTQVDSERGNASLRFDWKISPYAKTSLMFSHEMRDTNTFNRSVAFKHNETNKKGNTSDESSLLVWLSDGDSSGYPVGVAQSAANEKSNTDTGILSFNWKRYGFNLDAIATWSYSKSDKTPSNDKWFPQINTQGPSKSNNGNTGNDAFWGSRSDSQSMEWSFYRGDKNSLTPNPAWTDSMGDIGYYGQDSASSITDPLTTSTEQTIPTLKADLRWDAPTRIPLWFKTGFNARQSKYNSWQPTDGGGAPLANHYQYVGSNLNYGLKGGSTSANYDKLGTNTPRDNVPSLSSTYFLSDYHFDPHFGGNVADLNIPMINQTLLYSTYKDHPEWFYQKDDDIMNSRIAGYTGQRDLSETIAAGYLMGEIRPWKKFTFQAGYRYEYTNQEANTLIPKTKGQVEYETGMTDQKTDKWVDTMYKNGQRTKTTNTYSFWLPSAAAKYNITPNLTTHIGYSEGFGRVSVEKIAGNWKVNDTNQTATAPNPNLTPDYFKTYSAAVEYYFEPAGSFTFTYSYRKWDGSSYTTQPLSSDNIDAPEMKALIELYGIDTIQSFLNSHYTIYTWQPESVSDRTMQTLEFSYRQRIPAIPGLQIDANFTRVIPNWRKTGASSAPKLASGGITYSIGNFSTRISGNWRDRYYIRWSEIPENYSGTQVQYARFVINAEATYRLSKYVYIYATGGNLLNAPSSSYVYSPSILKEETLSGIALRFGLKNYF